AQAVSGVTKPASSIRSSAIRWPSGPTTAIETGTPISSAFSIAALMNLRHSTPRNFAILIFLFLLPTTVIVSGAGLFPKSGGLDHRIPFFRLAGDIGRELFG